MLKFVAAAAVCMVISACGGYLQDEDALPDCAVGGVVRDEAAAPLEGVAVAVQIGDSRYDATTDAAGAYQFVMPRNFSYPSRFAGTATKQGYLPQAVLFSRSGTACPAAGSQTLQLNALRESDIVFPSGAGVTHLGDDVFTGDINSQLQVPSTGMQWTDGFTYTDAMKTQYSRLCVSFLARGVQAIRQNTIAVSRGSETGATEMALMAETDPAGDYTQASYCFSLAPYAGGERVSVTIAAGNNGGLMDYDDFEFLSAVARMAP